MEVAISESRFNCINFYKCIITQLYKTLTYSKSFGSEGMRFLLRQYKKNSWFDEDHGCILIQINSYPNNDFKL